MCSARDRKRKRTFFPHSFSDAVMGINEASDAVMGIEESAICCHGVDDNVVLCPMEIETGSSTQDAAIANNMDPNVWGDLPDHLLHRVLLFLPFWKILRLRSVSKKWNRQLGSSNLSDNCFSRSSHGVLFIMFADFLHLKAVATYNPTLNRWHLIPLKVFKPYESPNCFLILATAGGLICLEERTWPNRSLIVSNPINRSYRKLPPMLRMKRPYVVGMMIDADSRGYRILVAQYGESLTSQYYESRSNSWKMNTTLHREVALIASTTSFDGLLFCLTLGPTGLVAYDVEGASWHDLHIKMPSALVFPHVIAYNGQLLVVGGVVDSGSLSGIRIWELDLSSQECTEVERMPGHLFHKLTSSGREHFFCVGQGSLICFNDGTGPEILMYGVVEKRWWWLPPCPLNCSLKRHSSNAFKTLGFSIEPRFDLVA